MRRIFTLTTEDVVIDGNNDMQHVLLAEGRSLVVGRLVGPFEDLSWQVMVHKESCLDVGLTPAQGMIAFGQAMAEYEERTEWGDFQVTVDY